LMRTACCIDARAQRCAASVCCVFSNSTMSSGDDDIVVPAWNDPTIRNQNYCVQAEGWNILLRTAYADDSGTIEADDVTDTALNKIWLYEMLLERNSSGIHTRVTYMMNNTSCMKNIMLR